MTQEEKEKWLEENAKIAYEFLSSKKNTFFDDRYGYKEFEFEFCGKLFDHIEENRRMFTGRFLRYFSGYFIYGNHCDDSDLLGKEIRDGAIKFTLPQG
jgi:hypothetical protein